MRSCSEIPLENFNLGGALYLSNCPGLSHGDDDVRDPEPIANADIQFIQANGVKAVLSLVEANEFSNIGVPDLPNMIKNSGIEHHWFPIIDRQIAKPEEITTLRAILSTLRAHLSKNEAVLIHCYAGLGRSGTLAALILRGVGANADEAITHVREFRQGAIESQAQVDFIKNWVPEA